jgi:hypothetical protein
MKITRNGVRADPKNMETLQVMNELSGVDLVLYAATVNWMRSAVPNYSKHEDPRQAALAIFLRGKAAEPRNLLPQCRSYTSRVQRSKW